MKPTTRKAMLAAVLLTAWVMASGCVVWPCWWCDRDRAPRMAVVYVHVYDYYTCAPIPWATVALYEEGWWDWDYCGSWSVGATGYTAVPVGYVYYDGPGPDEREIGLRVSAGGYYSEWYEVELDYWYPTETLHFYLLPWAYRDGGGDPDSSAGGDELGRADPEASAPPDLPEGDRPPDRVLVGEPRSGKRDAD